MINLTLVEKSMIQSFWRTRYYWLGLIKKYTLQGTLFLSQSMKNNPYMADSTYMLANNGFYPIDADKSPELRKRNLDFIQNGSKVRMDFDSTLNSFSKKKNVDLYLQYILKLAQTLKSNEIEVIFCN